MILSIYLSGIFACIAIQAIAIFLDKENPIEPEMVKIFIVIAITSWVGFLALIALFMYDYLLFPFSKTINQVLETIANKINSLRGME